MKRNKYIRPKQLQEQGEGGAEGKPRLKTSAMIASIAGEGQRTKPAPFGHALGCNDWPARTAFTTVRTVSIVQRQPGFRFDGVGCAWAASTDGTRRRMKLFMVNSRDGPDIICHPEERSDEGSARWRVQKLIWSRKRFAFAPAPLGARSRSEHAVRATPDKPRDRSG